MTTFTQETKDRGHKMLDGLIAMTTQGAIDACAAGNEATDPAIKAAYFTARDSLYAMLAKLYEAKAIGGSITGPDVGQESGDK